LFQRFSEQFSRKGDENTAFPANSTVKSPGRALIKLLEGGHPLKARFQRKYTNLIGVYAKIRFFLLIVT
jgi:hypothetical protein